MPARDVRHIAQHFPDALFGMLLAVGVPISAIEREVTAASEIVIAATNNRSVLGTLNDYTNMLKWTLPDQPDLDLMKVALWLADTPVGPLKMGHPAKVTRRLFGEGKPTLRLIHGGRDAR
jgi:hypothetical protein